MTDDPTRPHRMPGSAPEGDDDETPSESDTDEPAAGDDPAPGGDPEEGVRLIGGEGRSGGIQIGGGDLPHWTEPPSSQSPLFEGPSEEGDDEWSFATQAPRWRDDDDDPSDVRVLGGDEPIGALDESERPDPDDFFDFSELDDVPTGRSVFAVESEAGDDGPTPDVEEPRGEPEPLPEIPDPSGPRRIVVGGGRVTPGPTGIGGTGLPGGPDRDIGQAVGAGALMAVVALLLFYLGPVPALLLVLAVVTYGAAELLTVMRGAGYEPAIPVALVAVASMGLAAYHDGEGAAALVLFLATVTTMGWFLVGASGGQPLINLGATLAVVVWVGMFGSFAALLLGLDASAIDAGRPGVGILLGAIVCTVAYDVGGWFIGRNAGRSPLSAASPNKTWEGLIGGCVAAIVVGAVYGSAVAPFDGMGDGLFLGVAAAAAAPIGDLCQSLVKRDLGVKDLGSILPGHGGVMDRFDALLFVLPAVYYISRLQDFFL